MDSLSSVRDLRRPYESDVSAARTALTVEMAGARRVRPRHTGARLSAAVVGCLVVGGIAAGSLTGVFEPGGVEAASAAPELLTRAAVNVAEYDFDLAPGQYLATTVTTDQLAYVNAEQHGTEYPLLTGVAEGAIAAVTLTDTNTVYRPGETGGPTIISTSKPYPTDAVGDLTIVDAVLAEYLLDPWGEEPSYVYEQWDGEYPEEVDPLAADSGALPEEAAPPRPGRDFPKDPAEFLAAWEKSVPLDGPDQMSTTEWMLNQVPYDAFGSVLDASGEYRATFLRALALADDVTVDSTDGDVTVFMAESPRATYRLTVDTARGLVRKLDVFATQAFGVAGTLIPVGSSPLVPAEIPTMTVTVTQEIVDSAPAVDPIPSG